MSSKTNKRFAQKHPQDTTVPERLQEAVRNHLVDGRITCAAAHRLARELQTSPGEVGIALDLQEARIRECQLGLFGYGQGHKMVSPAAAVPPELQAAIEARLVEGRLPCLDAWRTAEQRKIPRLAVAQACEALKIKICKCQLGAF